MITILRRRSHPQWLILFHQCSATIRFAYDVADLDNDGTLEMITSESGILYLSELDVNGSISSRTDIGISGGGPRLYDIDQDGDLDLYVYNNGEIIQFNNDGTGSFSECSLINGLSNGFSDVGDFNSDGKMDYVYFTTCGYCTSTNYFATQD